MRNMTSTERFSCAAETQGILVQVLPIFLADQSDPHTHRYLWAYRVRLENGSAQTVQLIARHWVITDATGHRDEVRGPGVIGEQPFIAPGGAFEYVSGCPLSTPGGMMHGSYQMEWADGGRFEAEIPAFALECP